MSWRATQRCYDKFEVGVIVAYDYKPWRVMSIRERADEKYPTVVVLRPVASPEWPTALSEDLHLGVRGHYSWQVLPEHYALCHRCGDVPPCREVTSTRDAAEAIAKFGRYEIPGICPACEEPVTRRQKWMAWSNEVVPGGPDVTFHLRAKCIRSAIEYERMWATKVEGRTARLSCVGNLTNHNDGTYECTELRQCPGSTAWHRSYERCRCPDCHARGVFGCYPGTTERDMRAAS